MNEPKTTTYAEDLARDRDNYRTQLRLARRERDDARTERDQARRDHVATAAERDAMTRTAWNAERDAQNAQKDLHEAELDRDSARRTSDDYKAASETWERLHIKAVENRDKARANATAHPTPEQPNDACASVEFWQNLHGAAMNTLRLYKAEVRRLDQMLNPKQEAKP